MNDSVDIDRTLALWEHINTTINELAKKKDQLGPTRYRELLDKAYIQKRIVGALLRSLRPVSNRDLRIVSRYTYYGA